MRDEKPRAQGIRGTGPPAHGAAAKPRPGKGPWRVVADHTFLAFVIDQLGGLGLVESRAMFGGHGLYRAGTFFAIVWRGGLYFRTDAVTRADYEARGMKPFRPNPRQTLATYYQVPAEILEDPGAIARWARAAIATARQRARGRMSVLQ